MIDQLGDEGARTAPRGGGATLTSENTMQPQELVDAGQQQLRLLSEMGQVLSTSASFEEALSNIARLAVPRVADVCIVEIATEDGPAEHLVVDATDMEEAPAPSAARPPVPAPTGAASPPVGSGQPSSTSDEDVLLVEQVDEAFLAARGYESTHLERLRRSHLRSAVVIPLRTTDRSAVLVLATVEPSGRHFGPADLPFARELGRRCAAELEHASLFQRAQHSLALLDSVFSHSPVGFAYLDADLRYRRLNATFASITGWSIDDHIGRRFTEVPSPHQDELAPILRSILDGTSAAQEVEIAIDRSGTTAAWIASLYPVRGNDQQTIGVALMYIDITERTLAEQAHNRVDSQLRLAIEAARMGLWRWSLDDPGPMQWSETTAILLGLDPLRPPRPSALPDAVSPVDRERVRTAIERALRDHQPFEEEFRVVWPDGTTHWLLAKGQLQGTPGEEQEMIGILVDTTEQRAEQHESARLALRQARAGEQAVRMQRVTAALSEAMTVSQVCDVILTQGGAVVGTPRNVVVLLSEDGREIESVRVVGYPDEHVHVVTDQKLSDSLPIPDAIRTGNPVLLADRGEIAERYPDAVGRSDMVDATALAAFPITAHGTVLGAWCVSWPEPRPFAEGELIILLTLAAQCGQALDRARVFERERFIATALQRTLLPSHLPTLSGASAASRYRPSASGMEVGGDWYDVIRLSGSRVGLVIGDVGGHNIDSAAVMGQLRNAVRSYAWESHPPATVLDLTNRLLCGLEPGVLATCCYLELNLDDGIASVATAGHPPPLIRTASNTTSFMDLHADPPLGTDAGHKYEQATLFLTAGDYLALYTDGLIETRTVGVPQGMSGLLSSAAQAPTSSPDEFAEHLLRTNAVGDSREDDIALLVLRYEPVRIASRTAGTRSVKRNLPSSAASAGVARRFAADVMADWGAIDLVDQVSLCVSELVTNALIHTATEVQLVLRLSPSSVRVEVIDHSDRMPAMREHSESETSGRGLQIVQAVSSAWGVEPVGSGKAVWFQIDRGFELRG